MTVYVLTSNYICVENGDFNHEVLGIYEDLEEAQKQMKQEIKVTKENFFEGYRFRTVKKGEDALWSIWSKECPTYYFCDIKITKCEVK